MMIWKTLLNYITAPLLLLLAGFVLFTNPRRSNLRLLFLCSLGAAFICLFTGITYDLVGEGQTGLALWTARFGALGQYLSYAVIFRLSLTFPEERKMPGVDLLIGLLTAGWIGLVLFSDQYIAKISIRNGEMFRHTGVLYYAGLTLVGFFSVASIVNFYRRYKSTSDQTKRRLTGFMAVLILGVITTGALLSIVIPMLTGDFTFYPHSSIPALLFLLGSFYVQFHFRFLTETFTYVKWLFFGALLLANISLGVLFFQPLWNRLETSGWFLPVAVLGFLLFYLFNYTVQRLIFSLFSPEEQLYQRLHTLLQKLSLSNRFEEILEELKTVLESEFSDVKLRFLFLRQRRLVTVGEHPEKIILEEGDPVWRVLGLHKFILIEQGGFLNDERSNYKEGRINALLKRLGADQALLFRDGATLFGMIAVEYRQRSATHMQQVAEILSRLQPNLFVYMYYLQNVRQKMLVKKVEQELQQSSRLMNRLCYAVDDWTRERYDLAFSLRSSVALGGDYVDVIKIDHNLELVVVGDLAGQGIPAGFSMVVLRAVLRNTIEQTTELHELAVFLNNFIRNHLPREIFFAGVLMLLDRRSEQISFINCGIPVMFLYRSQYRSVIEVQGKGYVLGFVKNIAPYLQTGSYSAAEGDFMFTATDGMLDAQNQDGERYGKERLQQELLQFQNLSADDMIKEIGAKFDDFIGHKLDDDLTMLAIRFKTAGLDSTDDEESFF